MFKFVVNHGLSADDIGEFEGFYEKNFFGTLMYGDIKECTKKYGQLSRKERVERLLNYYSIDFYVNGEINFLFWVSRKVIYVEALDDDDKNAYRMISGVVDCLWRIFCDDVIVICSMHSYPSAWMLELSVEGMSVEEMMLYFKNEGYISPIRNPNLKGGVSCLKGFEYFLMEFSSNEERRRERLGW